MRSLLVAASAVATFAVLYGCKQATPTSVAPLYDSAPVETRNIEVTVDASGAIEPESLVEVKSKASGEVLAVHAEIGDVVQKNQTLATLVFGQPWVTANFKETQLTDMRPGQPEDIEVDAYPGVAFKGHVDSIMHGTGSHFALLPPENATGNYVKVVQRVPVKIILDGPPDSEHVLGLGMSVVPTVNMRPGTAESR